jgi:hypothetical protein
VAGNVRPHVNQVSAESAIRRKGRWEASVLGVTLRVRPRLLAAGDIGLQARLTA